MKHPDARSFNRARFLAAGAAAAAAVAVYVPALAADDLPVKFGTLPIDAAIQPYYAQEMGFFKSAGLDATIESFTSGGAVAAGIVGGAINVGNVDLVSLAAAHARNVPLIMLASSAVYTKAAQTYVLLVPKTSAIQGPKDLAGKTIAVNGLKNINQIPTEAWIDNNGGDSKSARFIEMPFPAMLPALKDGKIDAACVTEPAVTLSNGAFRVIELDDRNIAPEFTVAGWCAMRDWAQQNVPTVRRVITALKTTAEWANANHARSAQIVSAITKLPPDLTQHMHRAYYGTKLDVRTIQPVIDASAKYGVIAKSFPAGELISPEAR